MGYNTINVEPGSTTALGVQFENVANAEAGIPIKSLLSYANPTGQNKPDSINCDKILVYTGADWVKYYYYKKNLTATPYWVLSTDTTYQEIKDDVTLKAGQCFFFYRANNAKSTTAVTLAGGVAPLAKPQAYTVAPGSTTAMAWPWPESLKIKDITKYYENPTGQNKPDSINCDKVLVYTGSDWIKYYYYKKNLTATPYWVLSTDTTYQEIKDDVKIDCGSGFFFYRANNAKGDTIISFDRTK